MTDIEAEWNGNVHHSNSFTAIGTNTSSSSIRSNNNSSSNSLNNNRNKMTNNNSNKNFVHNKQVEEEEDDTFFVPTEEVEEDENNYYDAYNSQQQQHNSNQSNQLPSSSSSTTNDEINNNNNKTTSLKEEFETFPQNIQWAGIGMPASRDSLTDLRVAARAAKVSSRDLVNVFGDMLERIARASEGLGSKSSTNNNHIMNGGKASSMVSLGSHTSGKTSSSTSISSISSQPPPQKVFSSASLANNNNSLPPGFNSFIGKSPPSVSLSWYLWRIVFYLNKYPAIEPTFFAGDGGDAAEESGATVSKSDDQSALSRGMRCLLIALVYIDRISIRYPDFVITTMNLHRLVLAAMLVAAKFTDDFVVGEKNFARIGGVTTKELRKLELEFCSLIHFDLNVNDLEFERRCMHQLRLAFDVALGDAKSGRRRRQQQQQ